MPPQATLCKEQRRDMTGENFPCATELVENAGIKQCKFRADHVRPFKTGLCSAGWHEGQKPRSPSGAPCPTCRFWLVCGCECHENLSNIFRMTNQERRLVENPEYIPPKITGLLTWDERAQLHAEARERDRLERQQRMADQDPESVGTEIYSPSGRTRKGLLDEWVELHCKMWALNPEMMGHCTPAWLAEQVGLMHDVPDPSHGAVDAVLRRWVAVGYATMEGKPVRFTGFTEEGKRLGLEVLKQKRRLQQIGVRR